MKNATQFQNHQKLHFSQLQDLNFNNIQYLHKCAKNGKKH